MKPLFIAVTAITSSSALFAVSQLTGYAESDHYSPQQLFTALPNTSLAPASTPLIWVELAAESDLSVIARELDLSLIELSKLNEHSGTTILKPGTWIVLPERSFNVHAAIKNGASFARGFKLFVASTKDVVSSAG